MTPRGRAIFWITALAVLAVVLAVVFPGALAFVERGAREIRYLWWVILLVALAAWLIWGVGRKPKA